MEAEFEIEAQAATKAVNDWVIEYRELREDMADCLSRGYNLPDELVKRLDAMEQSAPITRLTNSLTRATDTDFGLSEICALITRSREVVNNLCSTFETYDPYDGGLVSAAMILLRKVQGLEERKATISRKSTTTTQPKRFNSPQSKEELTTIFQRLKEHGFFDDSADLETWLYICGVGDINGDFRPLNWISEVQLLGWLVYDMFPNDKSNLWEIAKRCFTVKGRSPNINSMKNMISVVESGYEDKSKKIVDFEKLLK